MNIALIGYGKMGHAIEEIACKRGHNVVCIIDITNANDIDSDKFRSADIAIEFTTPATAKQNILAAWNQNIPVVSGTTGWDVKSINELRTEDNSLLWSSNFSIGVNLFFLLNQRLAELIKPYPQYSPHIEEIHHIHKLDAPSGTAKTLAQDAETILGTPVEITSIREGEIPGTHTVTYDSEVDTITIRHEAKSRIGFALGAVIAAEWLVNQPTGIYSISDLLK